MQNKNRIVYVRWSDKMESGKVGASRHNARTTPLNSPSPGSKTPEPPSLIGGGGSLYREDTDTELVDSPPPIKRAKDYCRDRSCGDPWTFHFDRRALQQHVRSWFPDPGGNPYGKWASIVNVLGIETVNEIIQVYKIKFEQLESKGEKISNRAAFFKYCRDSVEQGMEARQNPADADKAWAALKPRKKPANDKWVRDHVRRFGR
jgi:hypothetical protein